LGCAAALNLPLLLCWPGWPLVEWAPVRALLVAAALVVVPGVPWVGVMICRGWAPRYKLPWIVCGSLAALCVVLVVVRLTGLRLCGETVFGGAWLLTNLGILLSTLLGGPPAFGLSRPDRFQWPAIPLFLAAYGLFFFAAVEVVPPMEDHDFGVLGCGYSLEERLEPLYVSDRGTVYQFAHPPLSYLWAAGAVLYFDDMEYLAQYDPPSRRALAASRGEPFEPYDGTVGGLSKGTGEHRVLKVEWTDYILDPPLADGSRRIPIWEYENAILARHYEEDPRKLPARAVNVLLAALTVAVLCCWVGRMTGCPWLGVLVAVAYATCGEVFVRSGYGGHFAGSNFAVLITLMVVTGEVRGWRNDWWATCLLCGGFAALVNHKLILLPAAIVVWELIRRIKDRDAPLKAVLHPAALGFAVGTLMFWAWGLIISPGDFFRDHIMTHYLDRLAHHNPLGYGGYPSIVELWSELLDHTGYLLLPMGIVALVFGFFANGNRVAGAKRSDAPDAEQREIPQFGLWITYVIVTAVVFSLVDWRQTKHLMPLLIPICAAPACWAALGGKVRLAVVSAVFCLLVVWNMHSLYILTTDFAAYKITPGW